MVCHRMKQFREYNDLEKWMIAEIIGIPLDKYELLESGREEPTLDIIESLARCYKVTVDEFYGYTPRITLRSPDKDIEDFDDEVNESLLRMSNLSWEEMQLVLYYRKKGPDDKIIKTIMESNTTDDNN